MEDAGPGEASEVTHATAQPETLCQPPSSWVVVVNCFGWVPRCIGRKLARQPLPPPQLPRLREMQVPTKAQQPLASQHITGGTSRPALRLQLSRLRGARFGFGPSALIVAAWVDPRTNIHKCHLRGPKTPMQVFFVAMRFS